MTLAAVLGCLSMLLGASSAVAAPSWLAPVDLSAPGRDASNPTVAMDSAGGAVAIWERQSVVSHTVQVSIRSPGGGFSAPVDLSAQSQDPDVQVTPGGEAVAAWWRFANPPGSYVLQVSTRPPGGSFSSPVDVTTLPVGVIPGSVQMAVGPSGATALAWVRRDPSSAVDPNVTFVEASVRLPGGGFSAPAVISPLPLVAGQSASAPGVAIDGAGSATVVWRYAEGADQVIQFATRPPAGDFSAPEPLSEAGGEASSPAIAVTPAGEAIAVWARADGEDFIVQASTRPAGGEFSTPPDDLSASGADAFAPDVATAPTGAATVVWTIAAGEEIAIQASSRAASGEFSAAEDLSRADEDPQSPVLSVNAAGEALVVWSGKAGAESVARATLRPVGAGFGAPVEISATSADPFNAEAAIGDSGDATVVWTRSNGANRIVQAAGFDARPPQLRSISIPPTGTVGVPVSFSADPFDVWSIASTSFSFGDGGVAAGNPVSHVYSVPGTFPVTVTASDSAGTPASASAAIAISPSYAFRVVKQKRNPKRGTATLTVSVSGPGRVSISGKTVKKRVKRIGSAGNLSVPILAKGKALKQLAEKGKARVRATVAFAPDGGDRSARRDVLVLLIKNR